MSNLWIIIPSVIGICLFIIGAELEERQGDGIQSGAIIPGGIGLVCLALGGLAFLFKLLCKVLE